MEDNSEYHERQRNLIAELIEVRQSLAGAIYESSPGLFGEIIAEHLQGEDENLKKSAGTLLDKLEQPELTAEQLPDLLDRYFVDNKYCDMLRETAEFYLEVLKEETKDLNLKTERDREKLVAFNKKEELAALIDQWDSVLDNLFETVHGLVKSMAYNNSGKKYGIKISSDYLDYLIQEGSLALRACMKTYNPYKMTSDNRSVLLSTYAYDYLRNAMLDARRTGSTVDLPRKMMSFVGKEHKARGKLFHQLNREPTDSEVAQMMGLSIKTYTDKIVSYHRKVSLSQPVGENEDETLQDLLENKTIPSPDINCDEEELRIRMSECLSMLTEREQEVIRIKWLENGGEVNNGYVGRQLGVSNAAISRLELSAFEKLRKSGRVKELKSLYHEKD